MLFRDENAARGILKNISYYRLKGYWWDMQKDISNHIFIQNVCFEDVNRTMVKTPTRVVNPRLPWLQINLSEYQKKRPFYIISTMLYLCNAVNSNNLFKKKLFNLFEKYPHIPLYKLGFNNRWQQENIWRP